MKTASSIRWKLINRSLAALAFALGAFGYAGAAGACTAAEGYRTPTNYELVERADLILLARVVSGPADFGESREPGIELAPVRVLKGELPAAAPRLFGATSWNGTAIPNLPSPLYTSHYSAGLGACIRVHYPVGGLLVAMFEQDSEGLVQITDPWSRATEDVAAEDAAWVRAIEEYLVLQQRGADAAAIAARRDALRSQHGDAAAQAIAFDLDHHLRRVAGESSPERPPHWLLFDVPQEVVAHYPTGEPRRAAVVRCARELNHIEVGVIGSDHVLPLSLVVDGQALEAEGEEMVRHQEIAVLTGRIPADLRTINLLQAASHEAAIVAGGETLAAAPTADIFKLLARRCAAFAAGRSADQPGGN